MLTKELEAYVRDASTKTTDWTVLYLWPDGEYFTRWYRHFDNPLEKAWAAYYQFKRMPEALCIARNGVIMVTRKAD